MVKKYYAVRKGLTPGIYETWDECEKQINGYSGAEYKGFATKEEAKQYLNQDKREKEVNNDNGIIAYVDGSFDSVSNAFSYGMVVFHAGKELHFSEKFENSGLAEMRNVAGEIKGAEAAMQYCADHDVLNITIYYDYEGIEKWCSGEWKTTKEGTIAYAEFYKKMSDKIKVNFVKVKGHSGNKYNEIADALAKEALGIRELVDNASEVTNKNKSVFIDREHILDLIKDVGKSQWDDFAVNDLTAVGNSQVKRYQLNVGDKKALIDFYFKNDGTTTIVPTGQNMDISVIMKELLEKQCGVLRVEDGKSYSIKRLPDEWAKKTFIHLSGLPGVITEDCSVNQNTTRKSCVFISKIGDRLTVTLYNNGTLVIQGRPAYLYAEAITFLSYCKDVSVDDIINNVNTFHGTDVKIDDIRHDMKALMPYAYNNIDETILKILSPALSLRRVHLEMEDYTCYAFSALRALEGYIKYLFDMKNINITNSFGSVFDNTTLRNNIADQIGNEVYQHELERLYDYYKKNRHSLFHMEQVSNVTRLIENKNEADSIVNMVIDLIENSYINIVQSESMSESN